MDKLDTESEAFIEWSQQQLTDEYALEELIDEIWANFYRYWDQRLVEIKSKLKEKMRLGALEHGSPKKDTDLIKKELAMEYLDLLGWNLMLKWREEQNKR